MSHTKMIMSMSHAKLVMHCQDLKIENEQLREERDNLLRGEYICKQCGLRKDSERSADHDF